MNVGYLKLQRRFFSHWLWEEKRSLSKAEAFLDLLQLAAFVRTKRIIQGCLIELEQGELVASVRYLADRWTWGKDKVAGFLKLLEADDMIRRETRQSQSVITLCNYRDYNEWADSEPDSYPPKAQTVARQRPDKVEEGKELEEGKETLFALDGASSAPAQGINWNSADGFTGIIESDRSGWALAYPAVDISRQLAAASEWLKSNPAKRKKNNRRFITSWLSRQQERGGDIRSIPATQPQPQLKPLAWE